MVRISIDRSFAWLALMSLIACAVTLLSGLFAALAYGRFEPLLDSWGLTLQQIRPIHDAYAFGWVFLGGLTVVTYFLGEVAPDVLESRQRWTFAQLALWTISGVGIPIALLSGQFTGREYLGYPPAFSLLILVAWLIFSWTFFRAVGFVFGGRKVYLYMWSVGVVLFVITFLEGHLYLLESVSSQPIRDLALQWKAYGSLVGAFNLLAYGSLMYIGCKVRGDESYARSPMAFGLFTVGLLNTFTNYGHHTYHLPQSIWIHWISFVVSMLEIVILAKLLLDVVASLRASRSPGEAPSLVDILLRSATLWTFVMLTVSIGIAVPPLNSLIHGTHVVVAHAMGSMIGIDSMILWAAFAYMVGRSKDKPKSIRGSVLAVRLINGSLAVFWLVLLGYGLAKGWGRYTGSMPDSVAQMLAYFPGALFFSGLVLTGGVLWLFVDWCRVLGPTLLGRERLISSM